MDNCACTILQSAMYKFYKLHKQLCQLCNLARVTLSGSKFEPKILQSVPEMGFTYVSIQYSTLQLVYHHASLCTAPEEEGYSGVWTEFLAACSHRVSSLEKNF